MRSRAQTRNHLNSLCVAGVEAAVEAKPEVVTSCDDSGRLPLHWAVSRGHIDLSSWLLDRSK